MNQCINTTEIQEGDLLAYVWGESRPEVAAHISRCAFCAAETADLRLLETAFQTALYRADCPETDTLLQYHLGMLPTKQQKQVQTHLTTCSHCQAEIQRFLPKPAQPSWLERLQQTGKTVLEAIQIPQMQPVLALRGESHQKVYQVGAYQVVLATEPPMAAENRWGVEGQVMQLADPTAVLQGTASLWQADTQVASDTVDEFGYFELENITSGEYTLHIELPTDTIVINPVTLT